MIFASEIAAGLRARRIAAYLVVVERRATAFAVRYRAQRNQPVHDAVETEQQQMITVAPAGIGLSPDQHAVIAGEGAGIFVEEELERRLRQDIPEIRGKSQRAKIEIVIDSSRPAVAPGREAEVVLNFLPDAGFLLQRMPGNKGFEVGQLLIQKMTQRWIKRPQRYAEYEHQRKAKQAITAAHETCPPRDCRDSCA